MNDDELQIGVKIAGEDVYPSEVDLRVGACEGGHLHIFLVPDDEEIELVFPMDALARSLVFVSEAQTFLSARPDIQSQQKKALLN